MQTKNTKALLLYLLSKNEYTDADKQAISSAFEIPQNIIVVNSEEQRIIIDNLLKKQ
jgi:hypothetical protein